jgi:catechol 2,3-dioxygenase-like lactoylglutathione lyase family enzyme
MADPNNMKDPFQNSELTTILVVEDLEASRKFYSDILGATLYREYGDDSAVFNFLNHWILLVTQGGPTSDKPDTHFRPPENRNLVSHSFTIRVESCIQSFNLLKDRGVKFITPPVVRDHETRCFFHDPDGHLFEISEYRNGDS